MNFNQKHAIIDFCRNMRNAEHLRVRGYGELLDCIASFYTKQTFAFDAKNIRKQLNESIRSHFHLPMVDRMYNTHYPFVNVNDLINKILRAIRRRL